MARPTNFLSQDNGLILFTRIEKQIGTELYPLGVSTPDLHTTGDHFAAGSYT